jgi:hypothetical protein
MLTHKLALFLSTLVVVAVSDQEPFRVDSIKGEECVRIELLGPYTEANVFFTV